MGQKGRIDAARELGAVEDAFLKLAAELANAVDMVPAVELVRKVPAGQRVVAHSMCFTEVIVFDYLWRTTNNFHGYSFANNKSKA